MRTALVVAAKDLRQRLRDRSALVLAFVAPFGLAAIISSAFSQFSGQAHATFAVADGDRGPRAAAFFAYLRLPEVAKVVRVRLVAAPSAATDLAGHDRVDAAVLVPAGFSSGTAAITIVPSKTNPVAAAVARALADGFVASEANKGPPLIGVDARTGGLASVKPASYYGPSMAILFVFFTAAFGARSVLSERRLGTLTRLVAAPVRAGHVVAGKVLATFVLGLASMLALWLAVSGIFGATWGDPLVVIALCAAVVVAAMGITTLAASVATSEEDADGLSAGITFVLALLGGNFIQLYLLPAPMQHVARFTPNGWALRAFVDVASGRGDASALPAIVVVTAFGVATAAIALRRARWTAMVPR